MQFGLRRAAAFVSSAIHLFCITTGVLSVSWYPPRLADNEGHDVDSVIPLLLDAADKQKLKVYLRIYPHFCENYAVGYFLKILLGIILA